MTHYNLFKKSLLALLLSNLACFSLQTTAFCEEKITLSSEETQSKEDEKKDVDQEDSSSTEDKGDKEGSE